MAGTGRSESEVPAEDEAEPAQGLGNTLQESAERTKQDSQQELGERCSFSSSRAAADNGGPCGPAAGLSEAGSQGGPRLPPGLAAQL